MFDSITPAPPDPILGLSEAFNQDDRPEKINLTIGVYRDDEGRTPVLECVKEAERRLLENESTKGYLGIDGLAAYNQAVRRLTLGEIVAADRVFVAQTPGGTGALKVAADFLRKNFSPTRVWISQPTWPNHVGIFDSAGLATESYPYLTADRTAVDVEAILEHIESEGRAGDVICLHACCHNPTGVDPTAEQWQAIAEATRRKAMLPLIDFAYHGFGDGLDEDRRGLVAIAKEHDEWLVCSSYSKNFSLYSERVGALQVICSTPQSVEKVAGSVKQSVRSNYSNPPRHGAAIVATILEAPQLRELWLSELHQMRDRIHRMRELFVEQMKATGCPADFSFLLDQRGMFSFSGLTPMQVDSLRTEHAIYIVGSGRINVAGITDENVERLTRAIAAEIQ